MLRGAVVGQLIGLIDTSITQLDLERAFALTYEETENETGMQTMQTFGTVPLRVNE